MSQELINRVYVLIEKVNSTLAKEVFDCAERLEEKGDKQSFKDAQNMKIAGNKLEMATSDIRKEHPHLFAPRN